MATLTIEIPANRRGAAIYSLMFIDNRSFGKVRYEIGKGASVFRGWCRDQQVPWRSRAAALERSFVSRRSFISPFPRGRRSLGEAPHPGDSALMANVAKIAADALTENDGIL